MNVCLPFFMMSIRKSESDVNLGLSSSFTTCISTMSDQLISNLHEETDTFPYTKLVTDKIAHIHTSST